MTTFKTIQPHVVKWQRKCIHVHGTYSPSKQFPRSGPNQKERPFGEVIADAHRWSKVYNVPDSAYISEVKYMQQLTGQWMWTFEFEFKA